jgi:hypothetical protein
MFPTKSSGDRTFNKAKYSDLVIQYNGVSWNVHKVIVCSSCNFFDAACEGSFKLSLKSANRDHSDRVLGRKSRTGVSR